MKRKKGALSLSVNAIVVLIIAITMLGLGLGFVRQLFGGATTKFSALIEEEANPPAPDASNTITLSRSTVLTAPKESEVIKIAVYNPTNEDWLGIQPMITCSTDIVEGDFITNPKDIRQGQYQTFDALFTVRYDAIQPSAHLCEIEVPAPMEVYSKDFTISVR